MTCKDITLPRTSQGYILGGLNEKYEMFYFDTQFPLKVCREYSAVRGPGTVMWTEAGGQSVQSQQSLCQASPLSLYQAEPHNNRSVILKSQILSPLNTVVRSLQVSYKELSS